MGKTVILDHPLIRHKITLLRDERTGTRDFRILVEEIAMLMGYEALRDLPTEPVEVKTPIATAMEPMLSGKKLVPSAKIGHIGLYRDEVTHEPHEYYCKLPGGIADRLVILPDPMLATGGSAIQAVDFIKAKGCTNIKFMCVIAAPEGLKALQTAHPDIDIYVGCLDDHLNEDAYIVPGLGDAGDRIFGTK